MVSGLKLLEQKDISRGDLSIKTIKKIVQGEKKSPESVGIRTSVGRRPALGRRPIS